MRARIKSSCGCGGREEKLKYSGEYWDIDYTKITNKLHNGR
jgi:hypothetical protein